MAGPRPRAPVRFPRAMTDRDLVLALRRGDAAAWDELLRRYLRLVAHVVRETLRTYLRTVSEPDVEDLVYELLAALVRDQYRALASLGEPYDLRAYLAVSARRKAIDFVRRPASPISLDQSVDREGEMSLAETLADPKADAPDGVPTTPEAWKAFETAFRQLAPRERLVVKLFYLKQKKYREIARATGIPMNSVGPTLGRAVEKLRAQLGTK